MKIKVAYDQKDFDDKKAEESKPRFSPIPKGWYRATAIDFNPEDRGNHVGGKVVFEILDTEYEGRKIFDYFVVTHNTSPQANEIGTHRIISWCEAVNAPHKAGKDKEGNTVIALDTDDLLDKDVMIWLKIEPERVVNGETKPAQNRVTRIRAADGPSKGASHTRVATKEAADDDFGAW